MVTCIGTSGWSYGHWEPELYPPGLPARDRLARYVESFSTVELNSSFYRWPRLSAFRSWQRRLPDGFRLSVKAPRGLTHGRRLYAPEAWAQRIAACWHELADKRAVLLVQLAPAQPRDDARLAYFLQALPWWVRVAVEFRHPGGTRRRLLRHERCSAALRPANDRALCLCPDARPGPRSPVRRVVQRHRPGVVGGSPTRMGTDGHRYIRVLQQRRRRQCRA